MLALSVLLYRLRRCGMGLLLLATSLLNACTGLLDVGNGHATHIVRDLPYAEGVRHTLDAYVPQSGAQAQTARGRPVVVFFYGGSWQHGDKARYRFAANALARHGYLTFVPDYRLYPAVRYPDFLRDAAQAVRYARAHAAEYGGDPERLVLVGHSAGAYIAVMLALDSRWLQQAGVAPAAIQATVGLAGPYDFLPLTDPALQRIFATPEGLRSTQPIAHARGGAAPMLLMAGTGDTVVDPGNTVRLAERLRADGASVETILVPGAGHTALIAAFAPALRFLNPSLADTVSFIDRHTVP